MLAPTMAGILIVIQGSLALAFSLAGVATAVRFRNSLKNTDDAVLGEAVLRPINDPHERSRPFPVNALVDPVERFHVRDPVVHHHGLRVGHSKTGLPSRTSTSAFTSASRA
jgi:hypothetical protein